MPGTFDAMFHAVWPYVAHCLDAAFLAVAWLR